MLFRSLAAVADPQAVVSGVVRQGAFCARAAVAQIGSTSSGTKMICSYGDGEDQPRWRAIYVEQAEPTTKKPSTAKPSDEEPQTEESEEPEDEESTTAAPPPSTKPPKTTGTPVSTQAPDARLFEVAVGQPERRAQVGRASCRERVSLTV